MGIQWTVYVAELLLTRPPARASSVKAILDKNLAQTLGEDLQGPPYYLARIS